MKRSSPLQWLLVLGACVVYLPTVIVGIGYGAALLFDTRGLLDGGTPWWLHLWGTAGVLLIGALTAAGARRKGRGERVFLWQTPQAERPSRSAGSASTR